MCSQALYKFCGGASLEAEIISGVVKLSWLSYFCVRWQLKAERNLLDLKNGLKKKNADNCAGNVSNVESIPSNDETLSVNMFLVYFNGTLNSCDLPSSPPVVYSVISFIKTWFSFIQYDFIQTNIMSVTRGTCSLLPKHIICTKCGL